MEMYKFTDEVSESIIKGIMKGYKSYLNERIQKKDELIISDAYAWIKGNHIDHYVANESKPFGISYIPSKAGYSWGYLQFKNISDKLLFLVKSSSSIERVKPKSKIKREENYMAKLAKINNSLTFTTNSPPKNEQLELRLYDNISINSSFIEEEVGNISDEFERFYIITYTLDEDKMISDISLCLPHPDTVNLYRVDSWNRYFETVDIDFSEDDFAGIQDDKEIETQISIGDYGIVIDDEDEASDTES